MQMLLLLAKWLPHFYFDFSLFCHIEPATKYLHFVNSFRCFFRCVVVWICKRIEWRKIPMEIFSFSNPKSNHFLMTHSMRLKHSVYSIFFDATTLDISINCVRVVSIQWSSIKRETGMNAYWTLSKMACSGFFNWLVLEFKKNATAVRKMEKFHRALTIQSSNSAKSFL